MLRYLTSKQGKIERGEGLSYELPKQDEFIGIFLAQPTENELKKITGDFSLPLKSFQIYARATHSKRYSTKPFQFVFVDYFLEKHKITHTNIFFILERNFMIICIPHEYHYYTDLFERICEELKSNGKKTIAQLLYLWLQEDTEENYDVLTKSEEIIADIEQRLIKSERESTVDVEEIIKTKRLLFHMTRRFWASAKIIFAIKKGLTPLTLDVESTMLLDDIYDTFHHQLDIAASQKDMLSDMLEVYATMISNHLAMINNNMSHVMKTLTSLTVIIMVPSLIASIYGMNFEHIPFAQETYGFFSITITMLFSAFLLYHFFSQKKWI